MSYSRVDYNTLAGKPSSAYYDHPTRQAWDVFTMAPVALVQDPTTHLYSEWIPTPVPAVAHVANAATRGTGGRADRVQQVTIKPNVSPWMIVPTGLFGLACIWMEITFHLFRK
jgi:hypothetical protein